ncbi:MAG TPA: prepilin-type N-terminal cleavage/methylation domain-containing protein [Patescibacteria group bacterium]|nr:prepilin-type N-terminal cleavage/methylation domain-containing protein [Patescibacteria group bacterium]
MNKARAGFTLIELLVAMALLVFVASLGAGITVNFYRSQIFAGDTKNFLAALLRARSEAMDNLDGQAHGLRLEENGYQFLAGGEAAGLKFELAPGVKLTAPAAVEFEALSGRTAPAALTLTDGSSGRSVNFVLNREGTINY